MRLLLSWVREFVDVRQTPHEVADRLGVRGFEVASVETLGPNDGVIDFEVTANRPDCLSVVGFARELATTYDLPITLPSTGSGARIPLETLKTGESDAVTVTIEDTELCPRYAAAVAGVTKTATPAWMRDRLQASGVRPISPIVDVTNYVLLELGHPMHAFDLATLEGPAIRIRRATGGEAITTLDKVEHRLEPDMLVIADARRAQAVAGVMGGLHSEVSGTTQRIVFESAYFKPASVRRTSKTLGLKTEASSRFERGADVNAPFVALQRATALMHQIGAGTVQGPAIDRYPNPRGPRSIGLRRDRLARLLGVVVPDAEVVRILRALGLQVTASSDGWEVEAPTFRVDLVREVDLIEEVGRHYGFDRIHASFPAVTAAPPPPDPRIPRDQLLRRVLAASGLTEAVTFAFIEAPAARAFTADNGAGIVALANPLSAKFEVLRPSLLPGLVGGVAHNRRHGRRDVALFEIGACFSAATGETRSLGLVVTGSAGEHWSTASRDADFFDMKGLVEQVGAALGKSFTIETATAPYFVAGQTARVIEGGRTVGMLGLVAPAIVEQSGAPRQDKVFAAELSLEGMFAEHDVRVRPLPRFPSVVRDLSIIVPDVLPAAIIHGTIQSAGRDRAAPLVAVEFFDRYTGTGVSDGSVSLSVRLTFQAVDRTLTDAEAQDAFDQILAALVREHGARQR
ncbi:MAG: phenylalanine--tRNA ligase subunit beta [Vicinamibacterales bacterium]